MGVTLEGLLRGLTVDELRTVTRQAEEAIAKVEAEAKAVKFGKEGEVVETKDGGKATWGMTRGENSVMLRVCKEKGYIQYRYPYGVADLVGAQVQEGHIYSPLRACWLSSDSRDTINTPSVAMGVLRLLLAQDRLPGVAN